MRPRTCRSRSPPETSSVPGEWPARSTAPAPGLASRARRARWSEAERRSSACSLRRGAEHFDIDEAYEHDDEKDHYRQRRAVAEIQRRKEGVVGVQHDCFGRLAGAAVGEDARQIEHAHRIDSPKQQRHKNGWFEQW